MWFPVPRRVARRELAIFGDEVIKLAARDRFCAERFQMRIMDLTIDEAVTPIVEAFVQMNHCYF